MSLNHVTANRLLTFINGVDVINFIEAMNISKVLCSLAPTSDRAFRESIKRLSGHKRILIDRTNFNRYEGDYDFDENKLVLVSKRYSDVAQPEFRLFIHPCFSIDAFRQLAKFYNAALFKCFVRLLPLNTKQYCADFGLVSFISFNRTISLGRMLNEHEKKLFTHNKYFETLENQKRQTLLTFVNTVDEFRYNLAVRFLSDTWLSAIDFSKLVIIGGSVLNALCTLPFPDTQEQDINLIYFSGDWSNFEETVLSTAAKLKEINQNKFTVDIEVKKNLGSCSYDLYLPHGVKLNLKFSPANNSNYPMSHILYELDIDICQVAYNGLFLLHTY
ncbi:unnamed protein product [Adineta ricciae]|uniref:Uncharacterized protein n=1 Tax=Adineta ricciae TaxID=249248 RepID=A0A815TC29_ADIRI|nr:unnamed protein product [Adineta ricciae]CAF1503822.1 unnamed protein product [Adineta ricciae]